MKNIILALVLICVGSLSQADRDRDIAYKATGEIQFEEVVPGRSINRLLNELQVSLVFGNKISDCRVMIPGLGQTQCVVVSSKTCGGNGFNGLDLELEVQGDEDVENLVSQGIRDVDYDFYKDVNLEKYFYYRFNVSTCNKEGFFESQKTLNTKSGKRSLLIKAKMNRLK